MACVEHIGGRVVMTVGIADAIENDDVLAKEVTAAFDRFQVKDWGNLCEEDKQMNDYAISNAPNNLELADRVLAKYELSNGESIYIITEWDLSVTTILFTYEY